MLYPKSVSRKTGGAALAGKSYLTGNDFTAADAYLFVVLGWAKFVQIDLGGCRT